MFLTAHAALGSAFAVALWPASPLAAFFVGWLSHYLGDFLPHGDEAVGRWAERGNYVRRFAFVASLDGVLLAFSLALIAVASGSWNWTVFAASAGAVLPDLLWGIEKVTKRKLFGAHTRFHHSVHDALGVHLPFWFGVMLQITFVLAAWAFVTLRW